MTAHSTPSAFTIDGFTPDRAERWVIYSALLAQVEDRHVGGVYSWGEGDLAAAWRVIAELTGSDLGESPEGYGESASSKVVVTSILVPLFDLDHPPLKDEEWEKAESLISLLAQEFGR